jgi:predicted nucleotide-binding protein (sugar kinase/HSP70/actin superfamily)
VNLSFPHLARYSVPITMFLRFAFPRHNVVVPPPITAKTVALGVKHSPEFVCAPFKYNLGNYIEALDAGADVLFGAGGGCRYGFYGEVHEEILRSLGYKSASANLFTRGTALLPLYTLRRRHRGTLSFPRFLYCAWLVIKAIKIMDDFDAYIRERVGFETVPNSFVSVQQNFLQQLPAVKNFGALSALKKKVQAQLAAVPLRRPDNVLRIGLIGELYTLMEPFANYRLETELAKYNMSLTRHVNLSYLLFDAKKNIPRLLRRSGGYLKYHIGADGTASVVNGRLLAQRGYAGLIHIKPFGCTPEVNAMPALQNVAGDYKIPVLYMSFDSQTSETGVKTRLEAFCDMLTMKKKAEAARSSL